MDVPRRHPDVRRLGSGLQVNESQCHQLPGGAPANRRNHLSSQAPPNSMKSQLLRSASNQLPSREPDTMHNKTPIPFPNSRTVGHPNVGILPYSATSIPQHYVLRNDVAFEVHRSGQLAGKLPNKDNRTTTLRPAYGDNLKDSVKFGQQADDEVFTSQSSRVEGARGYRAVPDRDKTPDVRSTTEYQKRYVGEKPMNSLNYIDPKLVKKVLESQKKRAQTPLSHLHGGTNKEVPLVSAGQRGTHFEKPEHHSSDISLSNRVADCRIADPETVSTGSLKESGYHSGDSVGDRLSENSEPGRNMRWGTPAVSQPFPAVPGAPDDVCEHYFLKGDRLMDLCNEQEVSGNWQQALSFLNQAIEFFHQATNVPGVSHDNVLRMRLKHNRAVLHRRKLSKQLGRTTETATRRLPCTPQEVKERSTRADGPSKHHQPISDHYNRTPIGSDYSDDTSGTGSGRGLPLYPDNFADGGNSENVILGVGDADLPETGLQWTSDDVKDINIYATLPKNRRRNGGPLVTDTPAINPVQTKLQSKILILCRNEDSQRTSSTGNQSRNTSGYRPTNACDYQRVPNNYRHGGMMHSREPVLERLQQAPSTDIPRLHDSLSHNYRSDDANVRRDIPTSDQTKFVRF